MIRILPVAIVAALSGLAPAQADPVAQSAGERRFEASRFDAVELASTDTVHIEPGAGFSVTATGDPRAVASLAINVRGGTLRVARTPGRHDDKGATVTVRLPVLRAATLSGSGTIEAGHVAGQSFTARLPGSGQLRVESLAMREVRLELGGSGTIAAGGEAGRVLIGLGGSGRIDAGTLRAADLTVDLGGSGVVTATASRTAQVHAGGSGIVRIGGHPACTVAGSSAAHVTCG